MADKDEITKKQDEPAVNVGIDTEAVRVLLDGVIPKSMTARVKQLNDAHQSNLVYHEDTVAVYEVSDLTLSRIDGTPGLYKIARSDAENPVRKQDSLAPIFTAQGLMIYDTYTVVYNPIGANEWRHQYVLIPKKEWDEFTTSGGEGALLSRSQQMAAMMQRAGGTG